MFRGYVPGRGGHRSVRLPGLPQKPARVGPPPTTFPYQVSQPQLQQLQLQLELQKQPHDNHQQPQALPENSLARFSPRPLLATPKRLLKELYQLRAGGRMRTDEAHYSLMSDHVMCSEWLQRHGQFVTATGVRMLNVCELLVFVLV